MLNHGDFKYQVLKLRIKNKKYLKNNIMKLK